MNVPTGEFRALRDQVTALEAEVTALRRDIVWSNEFRGISAARAYKQAQETIRRRPAAPRTPRARHLQVVDGGQP